MSTDLIKQVSEPISADNPAGVQLEDDPDYDKINTEIQKIGSIHGGVVDWNEVVRAGTVILSQKSKDIAVANWLAMGLFHKQGYGGLSAGLEICINLLDKFWETLYPPLKRIRGRSAPLAWFATRMTPLVTEKVPGNDEAEAIQSSASNIEKLIQLIDEKFGDNSPTRGDSPTFLDLRKALQAHASKFKVEEVVAKPEVVEKPPEERPAVVSSAMTSAPAATAPVPTEFTSVANANQIILKASSYLRETKPDDPIPYRIARIIRWYPVIKLPLATNSKTEIPGILPQLVQGFQTLLNSGEWDKLLKQSEGNFGNSPFWFDLQRFIDRAMTELGSSYESARQVIREELLSLVRRIPGILDLQFKNGIAFADGQTKMWIETEVIPSIASIPAETKIVTDTGKGGDTSKESINEVVAEARKIAAGGKLNDAISLLKNHLVTSALHREQFLWKLNMAKLCLEAGNAKLALPQLESLDEEVSQFSLEQWEPELALEVIRALYQCRRKLIQDIKQPSVEITTIVNDLYARLCRLDTLSALNLDSGS
jgi:type VI secretion system protein VasJ